jgi:hypothetical protein
VAKIVLPVTASLLAAMAVGMYLIWICKLRGTDTLLLTINWLVKWRSLSLLVNFFY